jgi:3-isopropylmalate/(R)-2-methylmalate dehydratase large subunit
MTVCNMAIEAGARAGVIGIDEKTIDYVRGRPLAPQGEQFEQAAAYWRGLNSDPGAEYDRVVRIDAASIRPQVTWGTSPEMVLPVDGEVPNPDEIADPVKAGSYPPCARLHGAGAGTPLTEIRRQGLHRLLHQRPHRGPARRGRGGQGAQGGRPSSSRWSCRVPAGQGAGRGRGADKVFTEAGFEWREPGCSMCLAMNADRLEPGERCASTSNRNFEGRQGQGGRTHLVSPAMAAAAAVHGRFVDVREI